ncbi:hypothetical protein LTR70_007107 [Exophiala xenobiotica]|uniref:Glycine zipper 2TM domain-containing protein n=1 Tax=Lithohypha guttulata TaxID=1690604 RepID=A0ABR0K6F3_9EURO|nr:hypothetical protein LTR24_006304 [Lithohypha guttulata]KAK5314478.1 hypothetical protein LTR70_007107 [Exophiala xenobiotica]
MSAPYSDNNGYNGYAPASIDRAPSPYDPVNRAPSPYHQQAPSPYQQQGASNSYYDSHPQQYGNAAPIAQSSPYFEGGATTGSEGERGLLGALGGAAGGHYVGHKTSHGFLGTVGGAIVGSLTEDWAKKNKPHWGKPASQNCAPAQKPGYNSPGPVYYSQPLVDTHTNLSTSTHVYPGSVQYPTQPPIYQAPHKPCGHQHQCGCQYSHRN